MVQDFHAQKVSANEIINRGNRANVEGLTAAVDKLHSIMDAAYR